MAESRRIKAGVIAGLLVGLVLVIGYVFGTGSDAGRGGGAEVRDVVVEPLEPRARPELDPVDVAPSQRPEEVRARARSMSKLARLIDITNGEPIAGALFHARHEQRLHTADEEGQVPIPLDELPSGSSVVEFEAGADGYCVTRGTLAKSELSSLDAYDIPLYKASPVRGHVFGVGGNPLRTVYITIEEVDTEEAPVERPKPEGFPADWRLAPEGIGGRISTKEDGSFRLAGLVPNSGGYEIEFFRPGYYRKQVPVTTRGPGQVTQLEVVLEKIPGPPRGSIEGLAYVNGELGMGKVHLRGFDPEGKLIEVDSTSIGVEDGNRGRFHFPKVPPGRVELNYMPYDWYTQDFELDLSSTLQNHVVEVIVVDGQVTRQDIRADANVAAIAGQVLDAKGEPYVRGPYILSERLLMWPEVDGQGRFEVHVPKDELYTVTLEDVFGAPVIEGIEPGTTDIELRMPAMETVTVALVDAETGESLTGYGGRVQMRRAGQVRFLEAVVDGDCHEVTACRYFSPPGLVEVSVRLFHQKRKQGTAMIEVIAGRPNHVLVELKATSR